MYFRINGFFKINNNLQALRLFEPIFCNTIWQLCIVAQTRKNTTRNGNGNKVSNGLDRFLMNGNNVEQTTPKQEVHEQPNGQFQITENGALNLMKAESMDMLVVNNLAQDLSVGREQSISMEKEEQLPDTTLITEPLDEIYQSQQHHQPQQQGHTESPVSNCLSTDGVVMAMAESLPGSFLSSLVQGNTSSMPDIDNLSNAVFTVPEVEVLTSNVSSLGELPSSPEKLIRTSTSQSAQEPPATAYLMEASLF